jgi:hypothetical protein
VQIAPNWRRFVHAFCLCNLPIELRGPFRGLCLCPGKLRFPTAETGVGRNSVRMLSQCDGKPSISRCLDHSAGKSVRRVTPMPCGSRPSMAALTISGARKASEIVMLTFRTLQPSRFAMLSLDIDASVVSSSSQRRPRAMAATSVARVSERIGRACCGGVPSGRRISRRRVDGVVCQGTPRTPWEPVLLQLAVALGSPLSWMTSCFGCISTRATRVVMSSRSSIDGHGLTCPVVVKGPDGSVARPSGPLRYARLYSPGGL